jgi:hypothetical protein
MTQPTAVQLRELEQKWRDEDKRKHSAPTDLSECADELAAILAAAEPAPEPQGGGGGERKAMLIGTLLDHWENTPNDLMTELREFGCGKQLDDLLNYMQDEQPTVAGGKATASIPQWKAHPDDVWAALQKLRAVIDASSNPSTYWDIAEAVDQWIRDGLVGKPTPERPDADAARNEAFNLCDTVQDLFEAGDVHGARQEIMRAFAALTPKPSTPQADGEVERVRLAIENKIADMACNGEQWADLTNFVNAKFRTLAASKAPAEDELVESLAISIYAVMPYDGAGDKPVWVLRGNSLKQEEARRVARGALTAALRPTSTTHAGEGDG